VNRSRIRWSASIFGALLAASAWAQAPAKKPNILVIWGDDVGYYNISAYNQGMMGYHTPNIDRIAKEGALFTDAYAQQSCTAGRASFILGEHPFRTGLLTIGMPGSPQGIPDWAPTIADLLKPQGYATGQFGKNHLGDQDKHLPTVHGFDEFLGNLYHLNAEEEPETYCTTWEGGFRVPMLVRWPGVIKPGTVVNDIFSQEDWLPTLLAAAGEPDIVEKVAKGYAANGKTWKVHLDGYNFLPYFKGESKKGPREEIFYFGQGGDLNAIRWNDWKVSFATEIGNIATAVRDVPGWPEIVNLRADPFEKGPRESGMYIRWYGDNIWLFVPVQQKLKAFLVTIPQFPFQQGSSLNAANINYTALQAMQAMKRLHELESLAPPSN